MFAPVELDRLIIHEIGTHVFRAANGANQPLKLLSVGLGQYLSTEEGLASFLEHQYGVASASDVRRYAIRVIAVEASVHGSFSEAFDAVVPYTDSDEAWDICIRTKRGIIDTAVPGAFTKDIVYAKGHRSVVNHLAALPDDMTLLFSGKIGLEMLPAARELDNLGLLHSPLYRPESLVAHFI